VLGTSSPPVRVMAIRIANAIALKADSALIASVSFGDIKPVESDSHVMIVFSSDEVDVQCHSR